MGLSIHKKNASLHTLIWKSCQEAYEERQDFSRHKEQTSNLQEQAPEVLPEVMCLLMQLTKQLWTISRESLDYVQLPSTQNSRNSQFTALNLKGT